MTDTINKEKVKVKRTTLYNKDSTTTSDDYNGSFVKERIKKIEEMKTPVKKKQLKKSIYNLKSTPTYENKNKQKKSQN